MDGVILGSPGFGEGDSVGVVADLPTNDDCDNEFASEQHGNIWDD